jgi:putative transposase
LSEKRQWIDPSHRVLSIRRQCELLGLSRSAWYYEPATESETNLLLMRLIDEQYTRTPFYGSRRMTATLNGAGHGVNRKRVQRLMRLMGLEGVAPGPRTSKPHPDHKIYPYLLRGFDIVRPDQVWASDITYLPMRSGFMFLVAILDWYSRYVVAWALSNTLDTAFCIEALHAALARAQPEIFNSDQGVQYTSRAFTEQLLTHGITISMDGRGPVFDNIFVERLWRSLKYELIYLNDYADGRELCEALSSYFRFYNTERPHQALGYRPPAELYRQAAATA